MAKPIFIDWCPKDALDGTQMLDPWEELAYRRLLDLIYATDDGLPDDDRKLAWMTKTGSRWKRVKAALIEMGKIAVVEGRITNARCQKTLEKTRAKIAQKSDAGKASFTARKMLKKQETQATDVDPAVATMRARVTQEPKNPKKEPPSIPPQPARAARARDRASAAESEFEIWWQHVPRKVGKGQAERAYRAARKIASAETLLAGIRRFAEQVCGRDPQYVPHPATWLNGKRWLDEPSSLGPPGPDEPLEGGGFGGAERLAMQRVWLEIWRDKGRWLGDGPPPDRPGCIVPGDLARAVLGPRLASEAA